MHVRSLLRLLIGAALLCFAWVVLTSGPASAAERSASSQPRSDVGRTLAPIDRDGLEAVLGTVVGTSSATAERPAGHPAQPAKSAKRATPATPAKPATPATPATPADAQASEKRSGTTMLTTTLTTTMAPVKAAGRQVPPVLDQVGATARSTVDSGLTQVIDLAEVAGSVPVAGEPLVLVTDTVVTLVQSLAPVGFPSPIVPLPIGDGTPIDVVPLPGATEAVATERDPSAARAVIRPTMSRDRDGLLTRSEAGPSRHAASVQTELPAAPSWPGEPFDPWAPLDSSPALPTQPSPPGGAAQGGGDPATGSPSVVLPDPRLFGRSSADWRVPRGLPAHPGTRPD